MDGTIFLVTSSRSTTEGEGYAVEIGGLHCRHYGLSL
jgi:hypothetical protein